MTVVEFSEMRHERGQQRQVRADGAITSTLGTPRLIQFAAEDSF
jgi:hypothetical protein